MEFHFSSSQGTLCTNLSSSFIDMRTHLATVGRSRLTWSSTTRGKRSYSWNDIPYLWAFLIRGVIKHREQGKSLPVNQRKNWSKLIENKQFEPEITVATYKQPQLWKQKVSCLNSSSYTSKQTKTEKKKNSDTFYALFSFSVSWEKVWKKAWNTKKTTTKRLILTFYSSLYSRPQRGR